MFSLTQEIGQAFPEIYSHNCALEKRPYRKLGRPNFEIAPIVKLSDRHDREKTYLPILFGLSRFFELDQQVIAYNFTQLIIASECDMVSERVIIRGQAEQEKEVPSLRDSRPRDPPPGRTLTDLVELHQSLAEPQSAR